MELNIKSQQNIDNKHKISEKEFKNIHSSMENIFANENKKSKAIRYVINMGKKNQIYKSPKIKNVNKIIDSDFSYEDDFNNNNYKSDKTLLKDMQYKIEDQKNEIRQLKRILFEKDKKINDLNYELYITQNELEDNLETEDYYKLLDDYDRNIKDYNKLKNEYNKLVDKFNTLKEEKRKANNDNKGLRKEFNHIKEELNKTLDEYNNIVEEFNKLKIERNKNNNDNKNNENLVNFNVENNEYIKRRKR